MQVATVDVSGIEFDPEKNERNIALHGVPFEYAGLVFAGPIVQKRDDREDYGEGRFVAIGLVEGDCLVVVYTSRSDRVRLISAWKGGRRERKTYDTLVYGGAGSPGGER